MILSTHIAGDIEAGCENIAVIHKDRAIYNGTAAALLRAAEGRAFTIAATKRQLPQLKRQLSITSMHPKGDKVQIRFIPDTLVQEAEACEPNIEDAYMLLLHKKRCP